MELLPVRLSDSAYELRPDCFSDLVSCLPEEGQLVLTLRFARDWTPAEIAEFFGDPTKTIEDYIASLLREVRRKKIPETN
jgi:DNA-directed RNA polymerase specialized sigma24 family protein